MKKILTLSAIALIAMASTASASVGISSMESNIKDQFQSVSSIAGMASFLAGFIFGIMGLLKLKANAANPNDPSNKVTTAFIFIFVGSALMVVPTVMGVGVGSLFGASTTGTDLTDGSFNSLKAGK